VWGDEKRVMMKENEQESKRTGVRGMVNERKREAEKK